MKSTPEAFIASDYARLRGGDWEFYYGYEQTTADGEWQFVARQNSVEVMRYTAESLGARDKLHVEEVLMLGIARYFWLISIRGVAGHRA